jgi:hypothetical protein
MNQPLSTQYEIITGFFLPLLLSLILQRHWSTSTKSYVSFGVVLLASFGTAYFQGRVQPDALIATFFTVLTTTIASFKALWQPTGIAQNIETKTTIGGD